MKHVVGNQAQTGTIHVTLNRDGIIVCEMAGKLNGALVHDSLDQTKQYIAQLKRQGRPRYLFIDASQVTGQDSAARSAAKALGTMGLGKIAIFNRNIALAMVIQYLIRSGDMNGYAQVFRNKPQALRWLRHDETAGQPYDSRLRVLIALAVAAIGVVVLVGWARQSTLLTAVVPGTKPTNPVVAIMLVLQAVSLMAIGRFGGISRLRARIASGIALLSALFGGAVMVQTALNASWHVDGWLFRSGLGGGTLSGYASFRTGALLLLLAIMQLAILSGQHRLWQRYVFHAASIISFCVALASLIGYGFGTHDQYADTLLLPMSILGAIAVILINIALQTVAVQLPGFARAWQQLVQYAQPLVICLALVLSTGVAWSQSVSNHRQTRQSAVDQELQRKRAEIQSRTTGYVSALRSYESFFESSDFVEADEYATFFRSSDLATYYPGFNAISFARAVLPSERASFTASMRQQASASYPQLATYTIYPTTSQPAAYPVAYLQPATPTSSGYGFDLASTPERRAALEKARDTDDVAATGSIDLNASRTDGKLAKRPGFFIAIPVYRNKAGAADPDTIADRRAGIYGFVNAVFEDQELFDDIFRGTSKNGLQYVVTNANTSEKIYTYNTGAAGVQKDHPYYTDLAIAGQQWGLTLYVTPEFGDTGVGRYVPHIVLAGGLLVTLLATALSITQVRRKERAVSLAAAMTEDLNHERDVATMMRQKDEAILSSIGDAVFAIGNSGTVILFNRAAENITGLNESEALGRHYKDLFRFRSEKDARPVDTFIQDALAGKQATMAEGTLLERADGTTVPVADSAAPVVNSNGDVEGAVVVFRDVTREKELERLKNEFVSMASHELRTPMGAIRAFVSMILAGDYGPVNKGLREPLGDIRAATLRLVDLVTDLLNVARIEAGRMKFSLQDAPVEPMLKQVVNDLSPLAKERGIDLKSDFEQTPRVQADSGKVAQVATNLIGNALKFTDAGSITVATRPHAHGVEVRVTDTGAGISAEDQLKIFGKFEQVSSVQEGRPAGTGLGLYISREIIRKMGGDMWIDWSEVGKGTTFAFTLPAAQTPLARHVKIDRARDERIHPDTV